MCDKLFCPECGKEVKYTKRTVCDAYRVSGEDFKAESVLSFCAECGRELWNPDNDYMLQEVSDEYRNLSYKYRKRHGILSREEIISVRETFGSSVKDFDYLTGIDELDISRYESGVPPTSEHNSILKRFLDIQLKHE